MLDVLESGASSDSSSVDVLFGHLAKRRDIADILVPDAASGGDADAEDTTALNLKLLNALLDAAERCISVDGAAAVAVPPVLQVLKQVQTGLLVRGMHVVSGASADGASEESLSTLIALSNAVCERVGSTAQSFLKAVPDTPSDEEKAQLRSTVELSLVGCLAPTLALAVSTMIPHLPVSATEAILPAYTALLSTLDQLYVRVRVCVCVCVCALYVRGMQNVRPHECYCCGMVHGQQRQDWWCGC